MAVNFLFHGTSPAIVNSLYSGSIQAALGGGEFGRGFYMGTSKRLAKRRGYHKTFASVGTASAAMSMPANTLVIALNEPLYRSAYQCRILSLYESIGLYGSIRKHRNFKTYQDDHDVIVGPIVGKSCYHNVTQYKFQSIRAETCLNFGCPKGSIQSKAIV